MCVCVRVCLSFSLLHLVSVRVSLCMLPISLSVKSRVGLSRLQIVCPFCSRSLGYTLCMLCVCLSLSTRCVSTLSPCRVTFFLSLSRSQFLACVNSTSCIVNHPVPQWLRACFCESTGACWETVPVLKDLRACEAEDGYVRKPRTGDQNRFPLSTLTHSSLFHVCTSEKASLPNGFGSWSAFEPVREALTGEW